MPATKPEFDDISHYLLRDGAIGPDSTLSPDRGWIDMDVRWLITKDTVRAQLGCMGRTWGYRGAANLEEAGYFLP